MSAASGHDLADADDRRAAERTRTIYRVVRIERDGEEGLARCRNISNGGMKLQAAMELQLNDHVDIHFSPSVKLTGRVVWMNGKDCGVAFDDQTDSTSVLSTSAAEARASNGRAPRLKTNLPARVRYEGAIRSAVVSDVSQYGLKLTHDGSFRPGLQVTVAFAGGQERRGVVRWTQDGIAGLMLLDPFSVDELGSVRAL